MRLKQYVFPGLVALALCAAGLVAWPAPAEAQTPSTHGGRAAKASPAHVVVRPGDCLWSMSQRLLPADATPQQIYNEVARIYALNRGQIGEDPNLIYAGQVLKVAPASTPVARAAGSGGHGWGAGADIEVRSVEPAPKAAVGEPSRETAQSTSRDVSRAAAREPSGTLTHRTLPKLAHAPILKPAAELFPRTASDEERWLPEGQLLLAAVVGTVISWGALCLVLAVVFLMARKLPTKGMPIELLRNSGEDQRRTEVASPAPGPFPATLGRPEQDLRQQLRTPLPKRQTRTTKGGGSQW
jgi:hypothetical protein